MKLKLTNTGKKFNRHWLYRNIQFSANTGDIVAVTGPNGSGKSTLIKILSGFMMPSEGNVQWFINENEIVPDNLYRHYAFCAPYTELPEEFTLLEIINWYFSFNTGESLQVEELIEQGNFASHEHKTIYQFSSGMKQRLKLLLAFNTQSALLLLDEPTSNLDEQNTSWYLQMLAKHAVNKTVFIASNNPLEYTMANKQLHLPDYFA